MTSEGVMTPIANTIALKAMIERLKIRFIGSKFHKGSYWQIRKGFSAI